MRRKHTIHEKEERKELEKAPAAASSGRELPLEADRSKAFVKRQSNNVLVGVGIVTTSIMERHNDTSLHKVLVLRNVSSIVSSVKVVMIYTTSDHECSSLIHGLFISSSMVWALFSSMQVRQKLPRSCWFLGQPPPQHRLPSSSHFPNSSIPFLSLTTCTLGEADV